MPVAGVQETYETLQSVFEYYANRPATPPALTPAPEKIPARWGQAYERPPFHFEED
jgi:hypothetical protein